jgi:acyl-CoA reductase-like NAD-dependent aldehyde dehydrogenase
MLRKVVAELGHFTAIAGVAVPAKPLKYKVSTTWPQSMVANVTLMTGEQDADRAFMERVLSLMARPAAGRWRTDTEDDAIAIANDSRFGLASGLWTRDLARVNRFIRDIRSGNVWVNTYL